MAESNNPQATLAWDGKAVSFPVVEGSEGERAVDVSNLRGQTGLVTLDPGFVNTGACRSAITFLDGERGILRYRGYPIEQLAEYSNFLEVAHLLIYGRLPSEKEFGRFEYEVKHHTMIHEDLKRFYEALPKDSHPMAVCSAVVGALSAFYKELADPRNAEQVDGAALRLVAKMPTIAAYSYKHSIGQPFVYPMNSLDYPADFLHMMFATPCEEYAVEPALAKALDLLLILHADHEQNCSTSTVRLVGSSMANLFASVSAGISALWGPLHGGANQAVIEMLEEIERGAETPASFMSKVKDKKNSVRLMGFGHRVYKNFDPRARILKKACGEVLSALGRTDRLFDIALGLEEIALKDDYFVSRKLYPNVDFYSGIIYRALGIPTNMFTVLFAMGRLPGWIAHWKEMHADPAFKIGRPRQIYIGEKRREYQAVSLRT
ncbi:citrate synthase [bacterium]|nr:citrate synthase [bacterium]